MKKRFLLSLTLTIALFVGIGFACPQGVRAMMDANGAPYVVSVDIYTAGTLVIYVTHYSNGDTGYRTIGI